MNAWPYGVDVSNWQGAIDWAAVAASGVSLAGIRATEGTYSRDPYFSLNWAGAGSQGMTRIAYHFAQPDETSPEAEAEWLLAYLDEAGPLAAGDLLALDLEVGSGDLGDWAEAFADWIAARTSCLPLLYSYESFITEHGLARPALSRCPLWLARWQANLPEPPDPWSFLALWQYTDRATVPGISGPVDGDQCLIGLDTLESYGVPAASSVPPAGPLPSYDPQEPARLQENDWDCSCESMEWTLYAWGRSPDDNWIEESMIAEGVVSVAQGCLDASGAGLAGWANRHYGVDGYLASNQVGISFEEAAAEAAQAQHPLAMGGAGWYHWTGLRGYDAANDLLLLANPAPGWHEVDQTMSRQQFAEQGGFNLVRVTHPAAEGGGDVDDEYSAWTEGGQVGSGLIEMMQADQTYPAQRRSTWLPLGEPPPSDVEECYGTNGVRYTWLLGENRGFRYAPTG